jgi:hypothetical protein
MKSSSLTVICLFTFSLLLTASNASFAQDCKSYYYMTNNADVQITIYDEKGTKVGTQNWKVTNVSKDGNGFRSAVNLNFVDGKGQGISKASGVYKCAAGKLMADIRMSLPQDQVQKTTTSEAQLKEAYIEYPSGLTDGMDLPDASFDMEMNTSGLPSTVNFQIKNRKVTGKEKVTSHAGSWDAYKITYDAAMKVKMAGIGIPMVMKTTEWFVPNFGVVKSETYNKKGKLKGSSLLTGFKK